MRQFDICKLRPSEPAASGPELVVVLQSDLLSDINTRVVAPLAAERTTPALARLRPAITHRGRRYRIVVDRMNVVASKALGDVVGSAASVDYEIGRAIDGVFMGF